MRSAVRVALALLLLAGLVTPVMAQRAAPTLLADLSEPEVRISYSFEGAELLVYGAIQYPPGREPAGDPRIAVVARGPLQEVVVRRKARVGGIWLNTASARFNTAPAYMAVATSRPVRELVDARTADLWELGLDNVQLSPEATDDPAEVRAFAQGLLDVRRRAGLFREDPRGVTISANVLYRARLDIPPVAPVGEYEVLVHLIEDGRVVATAPGRFEVRKVGFEARISRWAQRNAVAYGLAAVALAGFAGWAASLIGRR
jgi:uncharacterized protein (TIGR02186 family)